MVLKGKYSPSVLLRKGYLAGLVAGLLVGMPSQAMAQDNSWWFEIELIVFKRSIDPATVDEQFESELDIAQTAKQFDLLSPYLHPDLTRIKEVLPTCFETPEPLELPDKGFVATSQLLDENVSIEELVNDSSWHLPVDVIEPSQDSLEPDPFTHPGGFEDRGDSQQPDEGPQEFSSAFPTQMDAENEPVITENPEPEFSNALPQAIENNLADMPREIPQELLEPLHSLEISQQLNCIYEQERLYLESPLDPKPEAPLLEEVPAKIDGVEWPYSPAPYLLSRSSLKLNTLARDISRQRGVDGLLHMGWRQKVLFGRSKASSMHLYAGQNFASQYDGNGILLKDAAIELPPSEMIEGTQTTPEVDLLTEIQRVLADPESPLPEEFGNQSLAEEQPKVNELWELDGYFKVFLRYIQSTPYLHIDSELDYRAPVFSELANTDALMVATADSATAVQPDKINSYKFKQLRRVISTQIHYFDHPMFGMVVQIRRHQKPTRPEPEEDTTSAGGN